MMNSTESNTSDSLSGHSIAHSVHEAASSYNTAPKETSHTIDDYYALPEDQRTELIDGVFYDMAAPAVIHQLILGDLYMLFRECMEQHGQAFIVLFSPVDVRLDRDNYTMVRPDLIVICRREDMREARFEGAPDLVVEVLSPSTRLKDTGLKLRKYRHAGVREYWIVDPTERTVTVHLFKEKDEEPVICMFDGEVPVGISGGECRIDFKKIRDHLRQLEL